MSDVIQLVPTSGSQKRNSQKLPVFVLEQSKGQERTPGSWVGNICMFHLMVIQTRTANACITWKR
jgi:hypothetical protein